MANAHIPSGSSKTQLSKTQPIETQPIKTQRLTLREARHSDLGAFHELYSNKDVMQYWSSPHVSVAQTEKYLRNMFTSPNNGNLAFVIVLPPSPSKTTPSAPPNPTTIDEGKVIGHAGVWHPQKAELVFMIAKDYWGKGYMTEVLATLVPIFWGKGLKVVNADVDPRNWSSVELLKSAGFKQVDTDIVESYKGYCEQLRMQLDNPNGGGEEREGDHDDKDDGED